MTKKERENEKKEIREYWKDEKRKDRE